MYIKVGLVLLLGGFLSGCSNSAPDCSDFQTKELVMKIVREHKGLQYSMMLQGVGEIRQNGDELNAKLGDLDINMALSAIRTTDFNEKIGSYSCAAALNINVTGGQRDAQRKLPITYKTEIVDDGDSFYASVHGL